VSRRALVVVDALQKYDFAPEDDAERLRRNVRTALPKMRRVIEGAREHDVLTVYVNDNFGIWNAGRHELVEHVMAGGHRDLVEPLLPDEDTAFVVKARHSIFYETPLAYLLSQEDVGEVVLIGQATEQCILYSALDAYVRHLAVTVVTDACAGIEDELVDASFKLMARNMHADLVTSDAVWAEAEVPADRR
jgi:nicotinamidase-related amidase